MEEPGTLLGLSLVNVRGHTLFFSAVTDITALQGLLLEWNFNQAEALHAFQLASEADPTAAMPHWGIAYALGPGANRSASDQLQSNPQLISLLPSCP